MIAEKGADLVLQDAGAPLALI